MSLNLHLKIAEILLIDKELIDQHNFQLHSDSCFRITVTIQFLTSTLALHLNIKTEIKNNFTALNSSSSRDNQNSEITTLELNLPNQNNQIILIVNCIKIYFGTGIKISYVSYPSKSIRYKFNICH